MAKRRQPLPQPRSWYQKLWQDDYTAWAAYGQIIAGAITLVVSYAGSFLSDTTVRALIDAQHPPVWITLLVVGVITAAAMKH